MSLTWEQISDDPRYQDATPEVRRNHRLKFYNEQIVPSSQYKTLNYDNRFLLRAKFLLAKDTLTEQDHPVWKSLLYGSHVALAPFHEGPIIDAAKEALIQFPATVAQLSSKFLKGITFNQVDISTPNADKFLAQRKELGYADISPVAGKVAQFAGEFYPLNASFKTAQFFTKPFVVSFTVAQKALVESAMAGMIYSVVKGALEGQPPTETVKEMGETGLTWGILGGVLSKIFQKSGSTDSVKKVAAELGIAEEEVISKLPKQAATTARMINKRTLLERGERILTGQPAKPFRPKTLLEKADEVVRRAPKSVTGVGKVIDEAVEEGVSLYAGLPVNQIKGLRKLFGTKFREGGDLGPFQQLINTLHSPSYLAQVNPQANQIVKLGVESFLTVRKRLSNTFIGIRDVAIKGLSKEERFATAQLLDKYNNVAEVPAEIRQLAGPKVLNAFNVLREKIYNPIARMAKLGEPGEAGRVHGYLTRVFKDIASLPKKKQQQIIRTFAEQHNIDYILASKILRGRVPKEAFFGPLSKSRTPLTPDMERMWDLNFLTDMYIYGSSRKIALDGFLPKASQLLKDIPEGSGIWRVMRDYIDTQRGLPVNADTALRGTAFAKIARFEAVRQYVSKIGGNLSAVIFNATQYPVNDGLFALSETIKTRNAGPAVDFAKGAVAIFTRKGRQLAHRSGVAMDVGRGELNLKDVKGVLGKMAEVTGWMFSAVERYNKTASYIRNFSRLKRELKGIAGLTKGEKYRISRIEALHGVGKTQFHVGIEDRPKFFLGPVGGTIGRFKIFTIKQLEMISNLDGAELMSFLGIIDIIGGPDALPGIRELRYSLNENHPDSNVSKVLNTMQSYSLAGVTGLDFGGKIGIGYIPGVTTSREFWAGISEDFWGTVGNELGGPTGGDVKNLFNDIRGGKFDLDKMEWRTLLDLETIKAVPMGVQIKRFMRAVNENEKGYTEFNRKRPGYTVSKGDIYKRAAGLSPASIERQRQVLSHLTSLVRDAITDKMNLEDTILDTDARLASTADQKVRDGLLKRLNSSIEGMDNFNNKYYEKTGVRITPQSIIEAGRNRQLPLADRISRNKVQAEAIRKSLSLHQR